MEGYLWYAGLFLFLISLVVVDIIVDISDALIFSSVHCHYKVHHECLVQWYDSGTVAPHWGLQPEWYRGLLRSPAVQTDCRWFTRPGAKWTFYSIYKCSVMMQLWSLVSVCSTCVECLFKSLPLLIILSWNMMREHLPLGCLVFLLLIVLLKKGLCLLFTPEPHILLFRRPLSKEWPGDLRHAPALLFTSFANLRHWSLPYTSLQICTTCVEVFF